jgi:hypothetical protein
MACKRTTFEIETNEGKETVSGLTRKGLGLHRVADKPDGSGRDIWHVVHLKSGIAVLILNMWTEDNAVEIAEPGRRLGEMESFPEAGRHHQGSSRLDGPSRRYQALSSRRLDGTHRPGDERSCPDRLV